MRNMLFGGGQHGSVIGLAPVAVLVVPDLMLVDPDIGVNPLSGSFRIREWRDTIRSMTTPYLDDHGLSWRARGLAAKIATLDPAADSVSPRQLTTDRERHEAVETALGELIEHGYLRRGRGQQWPGGPVGWWWRFYPNGDAPSQP